MLGVDCSELRETRLSNHISRGSQDTLYQHRLAVFADHEDEEAEPEILRHTCELELTTASGALLFLRLRCEYVPVDDDDAAYCRTTISDVTAQKIAELKIERFNKELEKQVALRTTELATANRELITSEERLRTTLNTAADSIITIDRLGIVQDVNQATIQLSDYAMDELVGQHLSVLIPPSYFEKHADFIGRYLTTGQAGVTGRVSKVTGQRKDGSTFPAELAVSEIPHLNLFTGIIRDLTEQQRLQRNVLSVAARERRRIGADLHDGLCQELAGIAMIADALVLSEPRKTEVNHARSISDGLKHAARHARDIAHGLVPVELDSQGLMMALTRIAKQYSELPGVACSFECRAPVLIQDKQTAMYLYRICHEACSNAIRHGSPKRLRIVLDRSDDLGLLTILDDGCGIEESKTSQNQDGLGFQIMNYRADLCGGQLTVQRLSAEGGTSVACSIPLKAAS
jgi:PAS domain S-box-containing protein